jgi:hypothetical protein
MGNDQIGQFFLTETHDAVRSITAQVFLDGHRVVFKIACVDRSIGSSISP